MNHTFRSKEERGALDLICYRLIHIEGNATQRYERGRQGVSKTVNLALCNGLMLHVASYIRFWRISSTRGFQMYTSFCIIYNDESMKMASIAMEC